MARVWYAADGSILYASTASGKPFQTQDFENWEPAVNAPPPPRTFDRQLVRGPEPGAHYFAASASSQELWGVGQQLYHSGDGKTWETLTSYRSQSVVGSNLHSVAISPNDPSQLVVANDYGVWRSMDAGLTWASLNLRLPNLSVKRILATPSSGHPAQILTENRGGLELVPGSSVWRHLPSLTDQADIERKRSYSVKVTAEISAYAQSSDGRQVYVGSEDGRIWHSVDGGDTFRLTGANTAVPGHRVERLFVDPASSSAVLAALSGDAPHVIRTFSSGSDWDMLDSATLPDAPAYAITADHASGAIYVATEKGVYWTHFEFYVGASNLGLTWTNLTDRLPQTKAVDVTLDPAGVQLYAALDGYGVFGTAAPHRTSGFRLVNAADFSQRPASPGSLVSVLGERVNAVSSGTLRYPVWNDAQISTANSQIQVPFEAVGPTVSLALETANGRLTRDLLVQPVSPAIFVSQDGIPWILDADTGMPLDRNVVHPGQRLQVIVNGLGRVRPDWQTGVEAPKENTPTVVARVQAFVDRSEVPVVRATLAPGYVGMYLVEVQLPVVANYGAMELRFAADGHDSNTVQIVVGQ
jgi:uncharacterized protein (TIGR03437 family)